RIGRRVASPKRTGQSAPESGSAPFGIRRSMWRAMRACVAALAGCATELIRITPYPAKRSYMSAISNVRSTIMTNETGADSAQSVAAVLARARPGMWGRARSVALLVLGLLAILAIVWYMTGFGGSSAGTTYRTDAASFADIIVLVTATGTVE